MSLILINKKNKICQNGFCEFHPILFFGMNFHNPQKKFHFHAKKTGMKIHFYLQKKNLIHKKTSNAIKSITGFGENTKF